MSKKETKMKVTNCAKIILLTLLIGCSETDKPSKYVFDAKKYEKNIDNYVISKGEMDKFTCGMMSMVFTKEVMQAIKENKKPSEKDMEKGTPATINVSKNNIEFVDLGQKSEIKDNKVTLIGMNNQKMVFTITEKNEEVLLFRTKIEKQVCDYPFKKLN
jgi:hypothetical protein